MKEGTNRRGKFILIEGLDRCGKDTYIGILMARYYPAIRLAFPNEMIESGYKLRYYLKREIYLSDVEVHNLFATNRKESMDFILETIAKGINIFCSRYAFSGAVYTAQKGFDLRYCCIADYGIAVPDLTILLYGDVRSLLSRSCDGERYETADIYTRVKALYFELMNISGVGKWAPIDVDGKSIECVGNDIERHLEPLMNKELGELQFGLFSGLEDIPGI